MDIKDPLYNVIVKVGASVEVTFFVNESVAFVHKTNGTKRTLNTETVIECFRGIINAHIKNLISGALNARRLLKFLP